MKRFLTVAVTVLSAGTAFAFSSLSPEVKKKLGENNTVYVNTDVPGVHKEYDKDLEKHVWKNANGDYLCRDENMKPLHEIDKDFYFTGTNNNPDNPQATYNVQKKWDSNRGCYVWKDNMGNFLGRDKPSADKQNQWLQKNDPNWMAENHIPHKKTDTPVSSTRQNGAAAGSRPSSGSSTTAQAQPSDDDIVAVEHQGRGMRWSEVRDSEDDIPSNVDYIIFESDAQMREAESDIKDFYAEIAKARAEGYDVDEWLDAADWNAIHMVERSIEEYKRAHNLR